ncbi:Capsular polysaccharide biosynthesis protein [Tistlia consotensis]|uniref:Capsular polysaccharide biosynthesis protein n=1 Tax=Tistlia consotensis USBA 355 TaxID=560819 RepID=A0A1Y6BPB2_9PROT|nr:glycosyltransferase family 61 protein [Tistlia consotensis]SMF21231.1 Capsular polysaccharide biosynthesis protein [Tistlia consotensis USBA 355]SNR47129.1 Capsular polysaccharide biosynthesis protein [Tistlia consotensis]
MTLKALAVRLIPPRFHGQAKDLSGRVHAVLRRAWARVPGDSRTFGPPRRLHPSWREPAAGAEVLCTLPGGERPCAEPRDLAGGRPHWKFERQPAARFEATSLLSLRNCRLVGAEGAVIAGDDGLIGDLSQEIGRRAGEHSLFASLRLPPPRRVEGTLFSLATPSADNYYHWLFEALPRLRLLEEAGLPADRIYARWAQPFQRETLALLGVGEERILAAGPDRHLAPDRLLQPTRIQAPTPWAVELLRRAILPTDTGAPAPGAPRRLFITRNRGRYRRLLNEAEVLARLAPLGFTALPLEGRSVVEQARLFAGAELIVAPHGAALANLAFCAPGARVVELFAPGYVSALYWHLACLCGLDYAYLVGEGPLVQPGQPDAWRADFLLDAARLAGALERRLG